MHIVKNKLRNKMQLPMMSAILAVKYGLKRHGKCCKNFHLSSQVIKKIETMESYDHKKPSNMQLDCSKLSKDAQFDFKNYDEIIYEL